LRSDNVKRGVQRAHSRALLRSLGLSDGELEQPFIGIVNSFSEVVPGHINLRTIAEAVKGGVRSKGGTPFEMNTIGVCDGIAMGHMGMKYSLPSRELIADSVEIVAQAHAFDALVFIPNCDKIVPGMLMAAVRLNIPSIFISGGPMLAGRMWSRGGLSAVDVNTVFIAEGKIAIGEMSEEELEELERAACPGCGSCSGMFTANTMNCLTEALGMALPGNGTIPAVDARRVALAREAGAQVMELLAKGVCPGDIITKDSIQNAFVVDMALGGSTNSVLHLMAIANLRDHLLPPIFQRRVDVVPHIADGVQLHGCTGLLDCRHPLKMDCHFACQTNLLRAYAASVRVYGNTVLPGRPEGCSEGRVSNVVGRETTDVVPLDHEDNGRRIAFSGGPRQALNMPSAPQGRSVREKCPPFPGKCDRLHLHEAVRVRPGQKEIQPAPAARHLAPDGTIASKGLQRPLQQRLMDELRRYASVQGNNGSAHSGRHQVVPRPALGRRPLNQKDRFTGHEHAVEPT
jgi:hypothetical protein